MDFEKFISYTNGKIKNDVLVYKKIKTSVLNDLPYDNKELINRIYIRKLMVDKKLDNIPPYIKEISFCKIIRIKKEDFHVIKKYDFNIMKYFKLPFDCKLKVKDAI
jgi:hypothetical protein